MRFHSLAFGLFFTVASLLLVACQGVTTQPPPAPAASTQTPAQANAAPAVIPTLPPSPTAVPAATNTPEATPTKHDGPASNDIPQQTPTRQPATTEQTGEQQVRVTQPTYNQPQTQNPVFYEQNGLTLEYYWPLDDLSNLSADETEIFAYNESGDVIEFAAPKIAFTENGSPRAQYSGAWEKFPSRYSWDRIEYISILPSPYQGEALLVRPGEKAKIHWHMEGITSTDTNQEVVLELTVTTGAGTKIIAQTLVRGSEQGTTDVATAPEPTREPIETPQNTSSDVHVEFSEPASSVRWSFDGTNWLPSGTPPNCAEPFVLQTPVDLDLVTSALWPGQQRGAYVAHGGFRFDANVDNEVTVRAPAGSHLVQASKYLESGEPQYLLFFSVPCGFFYRFDHVLVVPPIIADALKDVPPATSGDSRTTFINPPLWVDQGEVVGTSVGISPSNIFVDFGLYDVRTPNNVVPNPAWAGLYAGDKEFGHYGVCFFDYLPGNDGELMRSLPTGIEGKTSDYCN